MPGVQKKEPPVFIDFSDDGHLRQDVFVRSRLRYGLRTAQTSAQTNTTMRESSKMQTEGPVLPHQRGLRPFILRRHETAEDHAYDADYERAPKGGLEAIHMKSKAEGFREPGGEAQHHGIDDEREKPEGQDE